MAEHEVNLELAYMIVQQVMIGVDSEQSRRGYVVPGPIIGEAVDRLIRDRAGVILRKVDAMRLAGVHAAVGRGYFDGAFRGLGARAVSDAVDAMNRAAARESAAVN